MIFPEASKQNSSTRDTLNAAYRMNEADCVKHLISQLNFSQESLARISQTAKKLVIAVRANRLGKGGLDAFMTQYDLSSDEGIALMCLAEAMLRIPDKDTTDQLIREKIGSGDWGAYQGKSDSTFVNAATWGLMLTGKILKPKEYSEKRVSKSLKGLVERAGEPVVRKASQEAMKILGKQFVMGRTISEALNQSEKKENRNYLFSYDMLGEAARTGEDAKRYFNEYAQAIRTISEHAKSHRVVENPGISVKLSALHPRYELAKRDVVVPILIDKVKQLACMAKDANIGFTIDAEEASRLDISLDIVEAVYADAAMAGFEGFGLAVQAYQKRASFVLDFLINLIKKHQRKMMVRLVKGAYWDTEIKDSQVRGLKNYPVFTRKSNTDVSYIACAKKMIEASDCIYPQFATHNAHSVAVILELLNGRKEFEFQCLKGMGASLYDTIVETGKLHVRVYAPVGQHKDLLPYLVRRLLENGANTSFVNRIVDQNLPVEEIIADPILKTQNLKSIPHPNIPLPTEIYGPERKNAKGIDLTNVAELVLLATAMEETFKKTWQAYPTLGDIDLKKRESQAVVNPFNLEKVGEVFNANPEDVEAALSLADHYHWDWDQTPVPLRAAMLRKAADLFEANLAELMTLAVKEAGKNIPDALAEVREAIDFCRYYAMQAEKHLIETKMPGPTGEVNILQMHGRGVALCISPWNFPLAIFIGQVTAALVAGNCVLAKPAAQTPLIAMRAVQLLHEAGVPKAALQLLPGRGSVIGDLLIKDERIKAIIFTGSTETAKHINQLLAARQGAIVPFIAETGGQNVMIADSSALPEQLVADVLLSAFGSAGQRCSALRVLFVQNDIADTVIKMLAGAMAELEIADPALLSTDVGPVIDEASKKTLQAHFELMQAEAKLIYRCETKPYAGSFFPPCAFEIPSIQLLKREIFGPFLHIVRFKNTELNDVIDQVNASGYGLTLGIQTRIDSIADYIAKRVNVGNIYVNRNMIGAVVGVQPFGGEGLSGTGPKAGGPHYILRLCTERTLSVNTAATGGNAALMTLGEEI